MLFGGLLAGGIVTAQPAVPQGSQAVETQPTRDGTTTGSPSREAGGDQPAEESDAGAQPPLAEAGSPDDEGPGSSVPDPSPDPSPDAPSDAPDDAGGEAPAGGRSESESVARGDTAQHVAALIDRIESHHRSLPHFETRFEQRFIPRIFGRERVENGRLTVRNPGRMRWEYEDPEPKVFVTDGESTWFHVPADQQVVVGSLGTDEDAGAGAHPLRILTGEAAILDHFDAYLAGNLQPDDEGGDELTAVMLTPREPGEIASLRLEVEEATGRVQGIATEDPEGNRTEFRFWNFTFGEVPPDSLFRFTIPPGTEVLTAGSGNSR